jgi:hypothetical protein
MGTQGYDSQRVEQKAVVTRKAFLQPMHLRDPGTLPYNEATFVMASQHLLDVVQMGVVEAEQRMVQTAWG